MQQYLHEADHTHEWQLPTINHVLLKRYNLHDMYNLFVYFMSVKGD